VNEIAMSDGAQAGARLLGPAEIRQIASRLGVRPAKRLGQNFVIDPGTIRRIVGLADLRPDDVVLEVGPGIGSLTLGLAGAARLVVAVEVDPVLAGELPRTVADRAPGRAGRLQVVAADALTLSGAPAGQAPTALVANLPYNVAVPVVLHLLEALPSIGRALVMVQAEVADRMTARPGSKVYGVPSVKLAWYGSARRAGTVSRTVFWPAPNVDSALVAFTRWPAASGPEASSRPGGPEASSRPGGPEASSRPGGPEASHRVTSWPLPTTVTPPADTTKPRALSCSLSTPTTAFSGTTTFLSRIASRTTAFLPIVVLCMMTERSTLDQELIRTPGDRTDWLTRPPETITPLLTTLLIARPIRSPLSCTNFAGGCEGTWVRIGHRSL
jgi:16S rRNA (adenine1518-N6/adenine1519-N6)-dimethyltransferase